MKNIFKRLLAVTLLIAVLLPAANIARAESGRVAGTGNLKVINAKDGLFISWDKVEGAVSYVVYKYDYANNLFTHEATPEVNYYQDYKTENGAYYIYRIAYVLEDGVRYPYETGVRFRCLKMPRVILNCTPNSIMVSWNKIPTATQYRVYRKAQGESSWLCVRVVRDMNTNYVMDYNVKNGGKYTYTVKAFCGNVPGSYNISGVSTDYWRAPTVTSKHSPSGVVLSWDKYSNKHTYIIDHRSAVSPSWKTVGEVYDKGTYTCSFDNIDFGVINYFRIRLKNTNLVSYSTSVYGIDPNKPMVALTYDDGPLTSVTNSIVSTLKKNGGRATFFVVGNRVGSYKSSLKNAFDAGCEIGNHTYGHYILTNYKQSTIKSQINQTNNAVKKITGKAPTLVRAPGGSINSTVKSSVEYPLIQWNVDTLDWKYRNANSVVSSVKNNVKDGSIILMHDLYKSTADATKTIVPWLKSQGYQMVTVTELMQIRGHDLNAGQVYYSGYKK